MVLPFFLSWYRRYHHQLRHFIYHNLLHADDPPHTLALGLAIGVFVAFTPTVGVQMVVAGFLSWVFGANKVVSVAMVWISNPATLVPIYWYCYRIGSAVLAMEPIEGEWWVELTKPPSGWWRAVTFYWSRFLEIAGPLWLGSIIVGSVCGYVTYYVTYHLIRYYRSRRVPQANASEIDID